MRRRLSDKVLNAPFLLTDTPWKKPVCRALAGFSGFA